MTETRQQSGIICSWRKVTK